jgi:release factor glutamine methyltransferase
VGGRTPGDADPAESAGASAAAPADTPARHPSAGFPAANVGGALREAEMRLARAGIDGARLEASLLLGHVLGHSRAQLLAALSDPLSREELDRYTAIVERRVAREPMQYLRGRAPFMDFELEVGPGVLIPRPETEGLVERALELWDPAAGAWAVDVGTGSGAIAIALARARPAGRIMAIDQSTLALDTAARNADRLGVRKRIALVRGDFLRALELGAEDIGVIVANPPYVADSDEVDDEVRHHEPRAAWAAGPTGLEAYERIIPEAAALLLPGRALVLELGYGQLDAVGRLLSDCGGWDEPATELDYQGISRILSVRRAPGS